MLFCKICNKQLKYISNSHLKLHHITQVEYKNRFGGELRSVEYKTNYTKHSEMMSNMWKNGLLKPMPISEERKRKTSERMKVNNPMKNPTIVAKAKKTKQNRVYRIIRSDEHRNKIRLSKLKEKNPRWSGGSEQEYRPSWDSNRKPALERDNYRCVECGITDDEHRIRYDKGLHVHHKIPYKISKNDSLENLVTLCVQHHIRAEQEILREMNKIKSSLIDLEPDRITAKVTRRKGNASVRD